VVVQGRARDELTSTRNLIRCRARANHLTRPALNAVFQGRAAGSVAEPSWEMPGGGWAILVSRGARLRLANRALLPWVLSSLTYVLVSINPWQNVNSPLQVAFTV
jgi:hypothetical protein